MCRFEGVASGPVGHAVIDQSADHTQRTVGIALFENERIRRPIAVELYFAGMAGLPLPTFEPVQTLLQGLIADTFGITHYFVVVFATYDFHKPFNFWNYTFNFSTRRSMSMVHPLQDGLRFPYPPEYRIWVGDSASIRLRSIPRVRG